MRKKHSILLRSLIVSIVFIGITSCIKEDLKNCVDPQGSVRISLKLDEIVQPEKSLLDYKIDNISVFVFNEENQYVTTASGGGYTQEDYSIFLDLPGGHYNFVVWTNQGDSYKTNKTIEQCETDAVLMGEMEYFLHCNAGDSLYHEIPDMLFGKMSQEIIDNLNNHVIVQMTPNNYTINLEAKGLKETDNTFDFSITDNNSHYNFNNIIIEEKSNFHLIRNFEQGTDNLYTTFKTLRLMEGRSPQLKFKNTTTQKILFSDCLVQTILKAYSTSGQQVDFNKTHSFDIVLNFHEVGENENTKMGVTVTVNGWEYTPAGETLE